MPPKAPIIRQQSASPIPAPPPAPGPSQVPNDLLVIQDIVDTLDAMPGELTRALGDLRELDAVLTGKLDQLFPILPVIPPLASKASPLAHVSATVDGFPLEGISIKSLMKK